MMRRYENFMVSLYEHMYQGDTQRWRDHLSTKKKSTAVVTGRHIIRYLTYHHFSGELSFSDIAEIEDNISEPKRKSNTSSITHSVQHTEDVLKKTKLYADLENHVKEQFDDKANR